MGSSDSEADEEDNDSSDDDAGNDEGGNGPAGNDRNCASLLDENFSENSNYYDGNANNEDENRSKPFVK